MDSSALLMHHDPDRSWITDPDPDHPKGMHPLFINRPFAATSSRDVIFIKLWATTLRMPEMEKAYRKYHNGQV